MAIPALISLEMIAYFSKDQTPRNKESECLE